MLLTSHRAQDGPHAKTCPAQDVSSAEGEPPRTVLRERDLMCRGNSRAAVNAPVFLKRGALDMGVLSHASGVFHVCGCHPVNASSAPHRSDNENGPHRSPKAPLRTTAFKFVSSVVHVLKVKLSSNRSQFVWRSQPSQEDVAFASSLETRKENEARGGEGLGLQPRSREDGAQTQACPRPKP